MKFRKFHGCGNSFLVLSEDPQGLSLEVRRSLCSPHYGLGADGIVAIRLTEGAPEIDFEMFYWNADGALGSFCGNGARLALWLAYEATGKKYFRFLASDGYHEGWILGEEPIWIGVTLELRRAPQVRSEGGYWVDTGSPHLLLPVSTYESLRELPLEAMARPLRQETTCDPKGVNVSFYAPYREGYALRTYERGVEAETQSCGTAAVALAALSNAEQITLYPPGGCLKVTRLSDSSFRLEGPLVEIAQGVFLGFS